MARFHFDLRHLEDTQDLRVSVHGAEHDLVAHNADSAVRARAEHSALAALPDGAHEAFTHFADVDDDQLAADDGIRWIHVSRPAEPGVHLAEPVLVGMHVPEGHLRAFYRRQLELADRPVEHLRAFHRRTVESRPRLHSPKLAALGMERLPADREAAVDVLVESQTLVTSLDTAGVLVSHHPDLANVQPYTATVVMHDHILPDPEVDPQQYNAMQVLAGAIKDAGSWSPVVPCTDQHGEPLTAEYDLGNFKQGQQLYTYSLADSVTSAAAPGMAGARRTASNDLRLSGKTWSPPSGTATLVQDGSPPPPQAFAAAQTATDVAYKWTVNERTDHHGVSVDAGSIHVDSSDNFLIDASNSYLRTLYAGYRLFDDQKTPIGDKQLLYSISSTNTLLGIPMPTDPTALQFGLNGAASIELYFGSLGTTDWEAEVSWRGALLTGLWQYGVPIIFIVAGQALTSTKTFNKIVNDRDLTAAAIGVMFPVVGGGVATAAALFNTKKVLTAFGDAVLGLVLKKGMEKLGEWILEKVAAGALSNAFGPVGWVFKLAAAAMDVEEMAVTTGEVLSSPANITVTVSRALDVTLTLHPDPRHGEAGHPETAVWPSIAKTYLVTLQYKNGTSFQLKGELPEITSSEPLPLKFSDVPAGGQFRIIAGVYSASGWLAGAWQSDWLESKPTTGTTLALPDASITENLVPLAPDAQYVFKERVVAQNGGFAWQAGGAPPSTTLASLACGTGATLCELVGITINNSAFQVGYAWRSSGQDLPPDSPTAPKSENQLYAVQNLSVLANPGSRLKSSGIGLTDRPGIAYAPSTNAGNVIDQTNFVLDPRGGGMNLRQVTLDDGRADFGLGDPGLESWGSFPLENVDAVAIHPSNAAIACSWQDHKLMILDLPSVPAPDGKAPVALMVSGEGIRQGLTAGPKALAVAPDGRLLVLETLNRRVQAFDTKGNPVPSFTPGPVLFMLDTSQVATTLDGGKVPDAFQAGLETAGVTFAFALDTSFVSELDTGKFASPRDPLVTALSEQGVLLAFEPDAMSDPTESAQIEVLQAGQSWLITDPRGLAWHVVLQDGGLSVYRRVTQADVRVEKAGQQWLIVDHGVGFAWRLAPSSGSPGQTEVRSCLSFFPLRDARVSTVTYLDMAVEAQGFVYVLSYWNDGASATDYVLDVYAPDGTFVLRTPDPSVTTSPQNVVAGRIAVDIWRNLYALTYEPLQPHGPQPGLAHWNPTPPLFTLPLSSQPDLNQRNIGAVTQAFAAHGITLSPQAFITVVDADGTWEVKDGETLYHIYRSGDGLQVYAVPA